MSWRWLLLPLTPLYAAAVRARAMGYQGRVLQRVSLPVPVISVGNISFGGTGKTPTVISLVRDLVRQGRRPAVLTRGYGRLADDELVLIGPGVRVSPKIAGDEPLELAERLPGVPIVINADRASGGRMALARGADVMVLDDGFQHLRLERNLDLVLIDAGDPWGGGKLPPLGRLREPLTSLRRASAVLVTKLPEHGGQVLETVQRRVEEIAPGLPVLGACLRVRKVTGPDGSVEVGALEGRRVLAFAGIGRPGGFEQVLVDQGAEIVAGQWYADHHSYEAGELDELVERAETLDAVLVTTAKDAVKLPAGAPVWTVEIEMVPLEGRWDRLWEQLPSSAAHLLDLADDGADSRPGRRS